MGVEQGRRNAERGKGLAMSKSPTTAQRRDKADVFSLAFLDIISCGFGAVVVLILIFKFDPFPDDTATPCLLYTSPSPRDLSTSRMPSSA